MFTSSLPDDIATRLNVFYFSLFTKSSARLGWACMTLWLINTSPQRSAQTRLVGSNKRFPRELSKWQIKFRRDYTCQWGRWGLDSYTLSSFFKLWHNTFSSFSQNLFLNIQYVIKAVGIIRRHILLHNWCLVFTKWIFSLIILMFLNKTNIFWMKAFCWSSSHDLFPLCV